MSIRAGRVAERSAECFLHRQGLTTVARNYSCRWGELDLVMRDGEKLLVVEVRSRAIGARCSAEESLSMAKRNRIMLATRHFIARYPRWNNATVRFDLVAISRGDGDNEPRWIKDAFRS
ncbi:MAG: YraN family protein [Gammaproteobacteria bacterium]